jgi:hypothetical protein
MTRNEPNRIRFSKTKNWTVWLLVFLFMAIAGFARAQSDGPALQISPFYSDVKIGQEEAEKKIEFKLTNNSDSDTEVKLSFIDLGSMEESGGVAFQGLDPKNLTQGGKYSLANWVDLERDRLAIKPGATEEAVLTINNKGDLSPGGHYGALLVRSDISPGPGSSGTTINPVLSAVVFLNKLGGEKYNLALDNVKIKKFLFTFPEKVELLFSNKGNTHVVPRGTISIKDLWGNTVANSVINPESRYVFPETEKLFATPIKIIAGMKMSGRYEMIVNYRFDGKEEFDSQKMEFYYINPVQAGLALLLTILLFSSILYRSIIKAPKKGQNGTIYEQKSP